MAKKNGQSRRLRSEWLAEAAEREIRIEDREEFGPEADRRLFTTAEQPPPEQDKPLP